MYCSRPVKYLTNSSYLCIIAGHPRLIWGDTRSLKEGVIKTLLEIAAGKEYMMTSLFLVVGIGTVASFCAYRHGKQLRLVLKKHHGKLRVLPQAITMLVMTAQVSELVRVVEHVSIVNVTAALLLLSIVLATRSGTESELH